MKISGLKEGVKLYPHQEDAIHKIVNKDGSLLLSHSTGSGKAQPNTEPVLTPNGFVEIGLLKVGDVVLGRDGLPTEIIGVYPQGLRPVYKIDWSDRAVSYSDIEHLWPLTYGSDGRVGERVYALKYLLGKELTKKTGYGNKWFGPINDCIVMPEQMLPIDAYTLGALLGDGGMSQKAVQFTSADPQILERFVLPEGVHIKKHSSQNSGLATQYNLSGRLGQRNELVRRLRDLGLMGHTSLTKFIPKQYLHNSKENRIALLQGLLDTDGSVQADGSIEVSFSSKQLIDDFCELVRSLGGVSFYTRRETKYAPSYRAHPKFPLGISPFFLARKSDLYEQAAPKRQRKIIKRAIKNITYVGDQECTCIAIAAEHQCYITRDYVVTHNTLSSIAAFEHLRDLGKADRALIVAPTSLRNNYLENGVQRFTDTKGAVFGNKQEITKGTHIDPDKPTKYRYHIVGYDMFRKDPEKYITAAKADTVIFDELHRSKNEDAQITQAIKKSRSLYKNFIGLTGSITSNTPADIVPLVDAMTNGNHSLGSKNTFEARFVEEGPNKVKRLRNPAVLKAMLQPYVHHVGSEVLNQAAPKKNVETVNVEMGAHQANLYRYVLDKLDPLTRLKLQMGVSSLNQTEIGNIFAKTLALRQISNSIHTLDHTYSPEQSAKETNKIKRILDDVQEHLHETPDGQVVIHTNLIKGGVDTISAGLKDRGIDHALFIGKGQPGMTEETRQHGVQDYKSGKKRVIVLSSAGGEGLDLPNTTFMAMADGHFNPEKINQAEARGVRSGGQAHRDPDKRQVLVRRYVSVLPKGFNTWMDVGAKIIDNLKPSAIQARAEAGAPAMYNPFKKDPSTDEWIYNVANRKGELNKALHETMKSASTRVVGMAFPRFSKAQLTAAAMAAGGLYGAATSGTGDVKRKDEMERDPNGPLRRRLSGAVGGTLGVLAAAKMAPHTWAGAASTAYFAPRIANNLAELYAPPTKAPQAVEDVLSHRQDKTDKAIFEEYWKKFGPTLENEGINAQVDPEEEAKYVGALKELYKYVGSNKPTGDIFKDNIPKSSFIKANLAGAATAGLITAGTALTAQPDMSTKGMALSGLPATLNVAASAAKNYKDRYLDPKPYSTSSKKDVTYRKKLDDEQLRNLLRGLEVAQVTKKQHFVK